MGVGSAGDDGVRIVIRDREGQLVSEHVGAAQGRGGGVAVGGMTLDPRMWPSRPPVVFLSGCTWRCSGGGQRPVALARELSRAGHQVLYCNKMQGAAQWGGGPLILGLDELRELLPALPDGGIVICSLSEYLPTARQLQSRGYELVYDVVDDWAAFAELGEAPWYDRDREREMLEAADLITCSAPALQGVVRELCGREAVLVRNGGPVARIADCAPPNDMRFGAQGTAVYVGYLYGQWFDWDLLDATARALPEVAINVVGAYTHAPDLSNLHMLGERPYPQAMEYVANADVGLIPFRGERLCAGVDPIKWYDYLAGCRRTVASAVMTDVADRPGTWMQASGEDSLAPAIERALASDVMSRREQRTLLLQSSWRRRRIELVRALTAARRERRESRAAVRQALRGRERSGLRDGDGRLRVTYTGTADCNMQPVCPYCSSRWTRAARPSALPRTPQAVVDALMRLTVSHGPLYISLCYGEPMCSDDAAWIIGQLARYNRVDVVSNILFPIERLTSNVPANGNVAFATSFHPHVWSVDEFIAKRRAIDAAGYRCGITEIVGYPPYLSRLAEWRETLAQAGASSSVLPFWGEWQGRAYPAAYSEDDWSLVLGAMHDTYGTMCDDLARRDSPAGRMCRCGCDYVWIDWDGTMWRCSMPQEGGRLGNVFRVEDLKEGEFKIIDL